MSVLYLARNFTQVNHEFARQRRGASRVRGSHGHQALLNEYGMAADHAVWFARQTLLTALTTLKQTVMAGLGIGFLSLHTVGLELQARRLVALKVAGFPIVRHWYLVHTRGKHLSPAALAFKQFLLRETATGKYPPAGPRGLPR